MALGLMKNIFFALLLSCGIASAATFNNSFTTNNEFNARVVATNISSAVVARDLLNGPTIGAPTISVGPVNALATINFTGGPYVFGQPDIKIDSLAEGVLVLDSLQNPNVAIIGAGLNYNTGTRTLSAMVSGSTGIVTNGGSGTNNPFTAPLLFSPTNDNAIFTNSASVNTQTLARFQGRGGTTFIKSNGNVLLPAGTALLPSLTWTGDETSGFFFTGGTVSYAQAGVRSVQFASSGINLYGASSSVSFDTAGGGSNPYNLIKNGSTGVGLRITDVFGNLSVLQLGEVDVSTVSSGLGKLGAASSYIRTTNFVNFLLSTNGLGSYSTNYVPVAANTAGDTNITDRSEVWNIIGTSGSLVFYNRAGLGGTTAASISLWTNTVSTTGVDYIVGPNCGIQIVTGVGTVISRRAF